MNDYSSLKRDNSCGKQDSCISCTQYDQCTKWAAFIEKHGYKKKYSHFDKRTSLQDFKTLNKIMNPDWITHHGFWPFIHYQKDLTRYNRHQGRKSKKRDIRYCSHIDRCIYQRYGFLLNEYYNQYALTHEIDESCIAYRTNKNKSNIDYAKIAFDFIDRSERCYILVCDFSKFFDYIDHRILKQNLCDILNQEYLPSDYYAVYKSITKYSSWSWKSLLQINNLSTSKRARKKMNSKETVLSKHEFRQHAKQCITKNTNQYGIPQGSPLSAVLSNIYMIHFDKLLTAKVRELDGLYLRYCDDILIILPFIPSLEKQIQRDMKDIYNLIQSYKYTKINTDKTKLLKFDLLSSSVISSFDNQTREFVPGGQIDYLGFIYDGKTKRIRRKSITKYYRRMHGKVKNAIYKNNYKNVYGLYTQRSHQIRQGSTFIDYARRASKVLSLDDPEANNLIKHNVEKVAKAKNRYKHTS